MKSKKTQFKNLPGYTFEFKGTNKEVTQTIILNYFQGFYTEEKGVGVLTHSLKGNTIYVALKGRSELRNAYGENTFVRAFVVTFKRLKGGYINVTWKSEEETPVLANCSLKVLNSLTPINNEYALKWRSMCQVNLKKRKTA